MEMNEEMIDKKLHELSENYLKPAGWHRSVELNSSVDAEEPVPWFTYPALQFIKNIIKKYFKVLEYGSGSSSLWWAKRVSEVVSVEHDPKWASRLREASVPNINLFEAVIDDHVEPEIFDFILKEFFHAGYDIFPTNDPLRNYRAGLLNASFMAYASIAFRFPRGYFDIFVVDGMARALTSWIAAHWVNENGFIIFDNSDRSEYQIGYDILLNAGFKRIDFWGPGPINNYAWCTSIFTRSLSVFDI